MQAVVAAANRFATREEFASSLEAEDDGGPNNVIDAPWEGRFCEGKLYADDYGEDPYVYEARYIDPRTFKGNLKLEGMTYEQVVNMETTRKYIRWLQEGSEAPAITVVLQGEDKIPYSNNRRRVVAALEAGIDVMPARVEIGRVSGIWAMVLEARQEVAARIEAMVEAPQAAVRI
jgi:hypothetical protein